MVHRHELEDPRARPAEDEVGKPGTVGPDDDACRGEVGRLVVVFSGVVDGKAMLLHQRDHLGTVLEGAIPVHPVDIESRRRRRGRRCPEDVRPEKLGRLRGVATGHAWIGRGDEPLRLQHRGISLVDQDDLLLRQREGREDPAGILRTGLGNEDPVDGRQIDPRRRDQPQPAERIEEEMGVVGGAEVGEQAEGRAGKR